MNTDISKKFHKFIKDYSEMNIEGTVIHCPYWMNKLKRGRVVLRGFADGKGSAGEIKHELIKRWKSLSADKSFTLTAENLRKFARREGIGIDCSGFAYRVLSQLVYLKYKSTLVNTLEEVFTDGINKTNVRTLTSLNYCVKVDKISNIKLGDIIRLGGGKHVAIILDIIDNKITYIHSSHFSTQIQGVHTAEIRIVDRNKSLAEQAWREKTKKGENFGKKYFRPQNGDGVFRLKIFN